MNFKLIFPLCATALLFACNEQSDPYLDTVQEPKTEEISASVENGTFVSAEQATDVAEAFFRSQADEGNIVKSKAGSLKLPVSIETVKDVDNPLMYVLNYPDGGFALVSATRDYYPVLAYSDENSFELSSDMGPVMGWIEDTKEAIKASEAFDEETKVSIRSLWNMFEANGFQVSPVTTKSDPMADAFGARMRQIYLQYGPLGWSNFLPLSSAQSYLDPYDYSYLCGLANSLGSPLEYTIVVLKTNSVSQNVGPLLTTKWHQDNPYNSVCNSHGYPAGCGAVALAQVMNFHRSPSYVNYNNHVINWSNMSSSAPYLVAAAGQALHTIYTSLGSCALPSEMDNAFRFFGYTVSDKSYNFDEVRSELLVRRRPVLMFGCPNSVYINAHYWVCDGVNDAQNSTNYFMEFINPGTYTYSTQGYSSPSSPRTSMTFSSSYLHMNWGWGGSNYGNTINGNNGWFYYSNVNPNGHNYSHLRENFFAHP